MRVMREPNLLADEPAAEESNLWVARQSAVLLPLRRAARDEAIEGIREFLTRSSSAGDQQAASVDDVYPFRAIAASDGIDSYFTKQDVTDSLKPMGGDFAAGRSVLGNHDYGTFSYGSTISGKVIDAQPDAPEYEAAFYPESIAKQPELATSKWLTTDGYVIRGLDLNGNKSDSIIKGMSLGGIRRISISFTVGRYTCGIDGQDMMQGWFGDPEPAGWYTDDPEACMHFPGIDYGADGYAYAVMHGNRALEESLVYMNASPSAMLMRKASVMAARGILNKAQRSQVEARFGMRLPTFTRRIQTAGTPVAGDRKEPAKSATDKEVAMTIAVGNRVRWTAGEKQYEGRVADVDAEGRLTVTTIDDEGEIQQVTVKADPNDPTTTIEVIVDASDILEADEEEESSNAMGGTSMSAKVRAVQPMPTADELVGHLTAAKPDGHGATVADSATSADCAAQHDALHSADTPKAGHSHGSPETTESSESVEAAEEQEEEHEEQVPVTAAAVTQEYVEASQRLVAFAARTPEAFSTADGAAIYGAERSIEQTLVDLSAERSVGGDVSRQHEARARVIADVLGGDLTVTKIRTLMSEAEDGRQAKKDLIRDAVAARVGVHGETFDGKAYTEMLQTQPMSAIRSELEAWQKAKREKFTAGRSVIPRDITKEGRVDKRTPARPVADKAADDQPNILSPR